MLQSFMQKKILKNNGGNSMFNFKKMAICVFSFFAFASSINTFAVTRYAKIVVYGKQGVGKTTFIENIKYFISQLPNGNNAINHAPGQNNNNVINHAPGHTTELSYVDNLLIRFDQNGNYILDGQINNHNQEYNQEVVVNICDTVAGTRSYNAMHDFINKGTHVLLILVDGKDFFPLPDGEFSYRPAGKEFISEIEKINGDLREESRKNGNPICRKLVLWKNSGLLNYQSAMLRTFIDNKSVMYDFHREVLPDARDDNGRLNQGRMGLELIARSIFDFGIDRLPLDNNNVHYQLENSMLFGSRLIKG